MFLPVIDYIVAELTRRLTENSDVVSGVSALHPRSKKFLDISLLKGFADQYSCNIESVEVEYKLIAKVLKPVKPKKKCEVNTLLQFVTVLEEFKIAFHYIQKLCYRCHNTSIVSNLQTHFSMS